MRIRKKAGNVLSDLPPGEKVSTVNNIFNSLWSSINVQLNETEITDPSSRWYAFKSYFENHLSYSTPTKENVLAFKGYIKDIFLGRSRIAQMIFKITFKSIPPM